MYVLAQNQPTVLIDAVGKYGQDVHEGDSTRWAADRTLILIRFNGYNARAAQIIGEANQGIDGLLGPTGWALWGLDWHFDIDTLGGAMPSFWGPGDTRHDRSQERIQEAVRMCANERGREFEAVRELGRGLHPLQDFYAHGNWRVWFFPSPIPLFHPEWYDDPNRDGHGPEGVPMQQPDDVWSQGEPGGRRYTSMRVRSIEYLNRFLIEVERANGPNSDNCLCTVTNRNMPQP